MTLPSAFLGAPIAHRALHDRGAGRPENSLAAVEAAILARYGVEIDVQLSADGQAMVFHDDDLDRLTDHDGPVRDRTAAELGAMTVLGSDETIPTLAQVLDRIAGRVAVLIEVKDQDGAMGPAVGPLEAAVAEALAGYEGPAAVMSFNPHSVAELARYAPDVPRGITTAAFDDSSWDPLPEARRAELRAIGDFARHDACFISHEAADLGRPVVSDMKSRGVPILCWTIRSPEAEAQARRIADNITFEGYPAPHPVA